MDTQKFTRSNDRVPAGAVISGPPDSSPALGTWFNCNLETGEILTLSLAERDGLLALRAFGAGDGEAIDWGEVPVLPHVSSLGSREVSGFTGHYDFGFMETRIAANLKYGVLVIQSYNQFRDGSGRPAYFTREFFHQDLGRETTHAFDTPGDGPDLLPSRAAGDRPPAAPVVPVSAVDLSPLVGAWHNTYRNSKGIHRVILAREGPEYVLCASGIGCDEDWGVVPVVPHATNVSTHTPAGFLARYDFGFSRVELAANEAKGLLIIASYTTFLDGSGRSSYFTREFFYREPAGSTTS
jgi:hypothetical protein